MLTDIQFYSSQAQEQMTFPWNFKSRIYKADILLTLHKFTGH